MNNIEKDLYSFLSNLKPEEISDIIIDYKLINDGYELFYIVDTYDIVNYTLPFTSKDFIQKESKARLSHQAIAYDSFFSLSSNTNLILLDEYKTELLSIKNTIQKKLKNFPKIRNEIIEMIGNKTLKDEQDNNYLESILTENLNVIIAILIFVEYGDNIYQRLIRLLNEKLIIYSFKSENIELQEIINEVFNEVRISSRSEILYNAFVDEIITKLLSLESQIDRAIYLENAYRDIAVIDRIIGVTETLKDRYPSKKLTFIYLSSTPFKTERLFNLMDKLNIKLPDVGSFINFKFNRNIFQCFLLNTLIHKKSYLKDSSPIEVLEFIKKKLSQLIFVKSSSEKIIQIKELGQNDLTEDEKRIIKALGIIINEYDKNLENSIIFDSYIKYRSNLELSIQNLKSEKSIKELIKLILKTDNFINTSMLINSFATPLLNISNIKQSFYLSNRFHFNKKLFHDIEIPLGKDIIRNSFHHFPGLLLFNSDSPNDFTEQIYCFLDLILSPRKMLIKKSEQFNQIITEIINFLSKFNRKSLSELTLEFLSLSLVNLVTRSSRTFESTYNTDYLENEKEIIDVLKREKAILIKSNIHPIITINENGSSKISYEEIEMPFIKEIDYLLLWLLRRDNKLDEAIKLGKDCISKYKKECRFYHGLGLANHSKAYNIYRGCKKSNIELVIKHFKASKRNLIISLKKYNEFNIKNSNKIVRRLVLKNIIGIHNTIADANFRIYLLEEKKNFELLSESQYHLNEMKKLFIEINENFDSYPTVNHTESELYYLNALYHFENGDIQKANKCILESTSRVLFFEKHIDLVDESFQKIVNDISHLRYKIFYKLGYLK